VELFELVGSWKHVPCEQGRDTKGWVKTYLGFSILVRLSGLPKLPKNSATRRVFPVSQPAGATSSCSATKYYGTHAP
jgi:hypothetical protein